MANSFDLIIEGATIVAPDPKTGQLKESQESIGIKDGKIAQIGRLSLSEAKNMRVFKAQGLHCLPGVIDTQVHFRDPGFPEKEDLMSGTRAAVYGGVTAIFDMPNTKPPTLSALDVADKMSRADGRAWCNYAFYVGGSSTNFEKLPELEKLPGVCGVKVFMGSSTGNLIVGDDTALKNVVKNGRRRMAIHAEDEVRLQERKHIVTDSPGDVLKHPLWRDEKTAFIATEKIVRIAREFKRPVHILHVTTAEEMAFLKDSKDVATVETSPQHLTLSAPECYERLGTLAQMNPPIREKRHQEALWQAVQNGTVDVLGSDHAPHTLAEKRKTYPETPSGMPGVQTMLLLMLNHYREGRLSLERVVQLLSQKPAEIFKIQNKGQIREGFDADLVLVDLKSEFKIENSWIQSTCGWTPFDGMKVKSKIVSTLVGGEVIMRDQQLVSRPNGKPLTFAI